MKHIKNVTRVFRENVEITFKEFCYTLAEFFIQSNAVYDFILKNIQYYASRNLSDFVNPTNGFLNQKLYKQSDLINFYNEEFKKDNERRITSMSDISHGLYALALLKYMIKYKKSKLVHYFASYYKQNFVNALFEFDCQKLICCDSYMMFIMNNNIYTIQFDNTNCVIEDIIHEAIGCKCINLA